VLNGPMDNERYLPYVRGSILFEGLDPDDLGAVLKAGRLRRIKCGAIFFYQDQPATTLYVLIEGRVKFTQVTADGQQVLLRVIGPGEMFGAVAALGDAVHPATAEAHVDCLALAWRSEVVADLMARFPRLALNALRFMAERLKEFQDRYREMATERAERRIARTLLRLAGQLGRQVDEGVLIDLALTRQDIAEMSGTTLFTASRILKAWQQQGIVKGGRERVLICNLPSLASIAEDSPADGAP
jgi:CRP-like cAMP-binding protein